MVLSKVVVVEARDCSVSEGTNGRGHHGLNLLRSDVGIVDDPLGNEWSLDDVHGHIEVGGWVQLASGDSALQGNDGWPLWLDSY